MSPVVKIGIVFVLLAGAVGFLLLGSGAQEAFVYSKTVAEVMRDPGAFRTRTVRVTGDLRPGSIEFREDPCEWRFVLTTDEVAMPVSFPQCVVPDTFRDGFGIKVVVEGRLQEEHFLATQVVPQCPSRYEMEQRQQQGEEMPHALPPET